MLLLIPSSPHSGGITSAIFVIHFSQYAERATLTIPVTIWLISAVTADCLIALLLVYHLHAARQQVARFESSNLVKPLERLIYSSLETGAATALVAILTLVTYLADKSSNVSPAIGFSLGRVYSLTTIFCLL